MNNTQVYYPNSNRTKEHSLWWKDESIKKKKEQTVLT